MKTADAERRSETLEHATCPSFDEAPLEDSGLVLTIRGELDIAAAPELRARVSGILDAGVRRLVVDLRAVSFLDSTALAVFIRARTRLLDDGHLVLVSARDSYARLIFEVAGLAHELDVVETLDDGLRRAAASKSATG